MINEAEEMLRRIDAQATQFCVDNYRHPTAQDILVIKNAMMVGAAIRMAIEQENVTAENEALEVQLASLLLPLNGGAN